MITIKHNCSKCQHELMFIGNDINRKYEHMTVDYPDNSSVPNATLTGHKFIQCPCCGEINILSECSTTAHLTGNSITEYTTMKNQYGIVALKKISDSEFELFSNYDQEIPVSDSTNNIIHL